MSRKYLFFLLLLIGSLSAFGQKKSFRKSFYRNDIYFDSGKYDLKPDAYLVLDSLLFYFKKDSSRTIFITAHTDADGSTQSNLILSQKRAHTTRQYLEQKGVNPNKITSIEAGESQPIASNKDEIGRQKNRRVSLEISKKVPLIKLSGTVKDSSGAIKDAWVYLRSAVYEDSTQTNQEGYYEINAVDRTNASISFISKDHFVETQNINTEVAKLKPLEIKLVMPQVGQTAEIKNIYFFGNQANFLPSSMPALKDLLLFMQINKSYQIEIDGHVNWPNLPPVEKNSELFQLSEARAKAVFNYLIENGVQMTRMTTVGYGNWRMRFPKANNELQQEANRRVEIKILHK